MSIVMAEHARTRESVYTVQSEFSIDYVINIL